MPKSYALTKLQNQSNLLSEPQLYCYDNDTEICRLFEAVFGKPMGKTESHKHFQWEYLENPAGRAVIFVAKNDDGQISSAYAVLPIKIKAMTDVVYGSLSFDTMTHPYYRGQGLFPKQARETYTYLANNHNVFTYGFPNKNSEMIFIDKLEWFNICDFPLIIKIINFEPLLLKYLTNKILSRYLGLTFNYISNLIFSNKIGHIEDLIIAETKGFDAEFDKFWNLNRSLFQICVERNSTYLKWRYSRPEENYIILKMKQNDAMVGYAVLKIEDRFNLRTGFILDFVVTPDKKYMDALLASITDRFRQEAVALISALMMRHTPYAPLFGRNGFFRLPPRLHPQEINFGARINIDNEKYEGIRNPHNWFITWGDTDLL